MSTQIAHFEMSHSAEPDVAPPGTLGNDAFLGDGPSMAARGIVVAVMLVTPFWMLVAFTLYLLI